MKTADAAEFDSQSTHGIVFRKTKLAPRLSFFGERKQQNE